MDSCSVFGWLTIWLWDEQLQFSFRKLERNPDYLGGGLLPELRRWSAVLCVQWEAAEGRTFHRQMLMCFNAECLAYR